MNELLQNVLREIRGAWRFRWIAMATAWIICLIGWPIVFSLPDQFEAEARFFVDTSTRLDEVMGGVIIDADERSQIALVRQAMLGAPVLEAVARKTDLDLRASTQREKQDLIETLQKKIRIESSTLERNRRADDDGIYSILYRDRDRNKSKAVVTQLLETFKEDVVSGRAEGSDKTVQFLNREIEQYGAQLRLKEQAIAEFKKNNVGLLPGESGGYFERMQTLMSDARAVQAELGVLVDRRNALSAQLRGENPIMPGEDGTGSGMPLSGIDKEIDDLEARIDDLLTRYTEKWPDVIAARNQLDQLVTRRAQQLRDLRNGGGDAGGVASNNPVYQQIQIAYNETNIEIATLERKLIDYRTQIAELQARVDVVPEVEASLAQLTRDYEQIRSVYGELRERLEQEELRRKRIGWDGVTFRVIDPPKVGFEPVSPHRSLLLILVTLCALAGGAGLAYFLHLLKPVFIDTTGLRETTGVPVLGSVGMVFKSRHKEQRRQELTALVGAAALLIVCLGIVLLIEFMGSSPGDSAVGVASL